MFRTLKNPTSLKFEIYIQLKYTNSLGSVWVHYLVLEFNSTKKYYITALTILMLQGLGLGYQSGIEVVVRKALEKKQWREPR